MEDIDEFGTDFSRSWQIVGGDIQLVSNKENLVQSIDNRFNCVLDSLDLYYFNYGTVLSHFLGWKKDEDTLGFMKLEVSECLRQDPRIDDFDLELNYKSDGSVLIKMDLVYGDESDLSLSMVLSENGDLEVEEDGD